MKTTHYEAILKELKKRPKNGATNRDLFAFSNSPWKRIAELEAKGVKIRRTNDKDDPRLRRYVLADPKQKRIAELLREYSTRRKAV